MKKFVKLVTRHFFRLLAAIITIGILAVTLHLLTPSIDSAGTGSLNFIAAIGIMSVVSAIAVHLFNDSSKKDGEQLEEERFYG